MDDIDRQILALVAEGLSDRQIAREVGLSRTAVRKRRTKLRARAADDDPWTDDDAERELSLFDAEDDDPGVVPPIRYVGTERVFCAGARGEGGRWADSRRYLDATGRSVDKLDLYRWCEYRANDHDDRAGAAAVRADVARQITEYEARQRAEAVSRVCSPAMPVGTLWAQSGHILVGLCRSTL